MCRLDAVFRALADRRRRIAVSCLRTNEELTLADMAELVAERERSERLPNIDAETVRDVYLSLYHTHVPLLENADIVRYEQERDLVVRADRYPVALQRAAEELAHLRGST